MEGYGYPYPQYPGALPGPSYPDHGDGYEDHFGPPVIMDRSRPKHRTRNNRGKRSHSTSSKSRSRSRSKSGSRSMSRSKSRARSRSRSSRSDSGSRAKELVMREPSFLDAFRILYLSSSNSKKSTTKYLATKKRQDRIEEVLKSDGLGSKRWLFYPRSQNSEPVGGQVAGQRDSSDQRIKIDGQWFKKYKRSQSVDRDAPVAKLKRWELIFYKKLGFIRAE